MREPSKNQDVSSINYALYFVILNIDDETVVLYLC